MPDEAIFKVRREIAFMFTRVQFFFFSTPSNIFYTLRFRYSRPVSLSVS